jgi:hypothetical protein
MLRKGGLLKRISKSATDLSGCTRKTHSSSPDEEEERPLHCDHDPDVRPTSATPTAKRHVGVSGVVGRLRDRLVGATHRRGSASTDSTPETARRGSGASYAQG